MTKVEKEDIAQPAPMQQEQTLNAFGRLGILLGQNIVEVEVLRDQLSDASRRLAASGDTIKQQAEDIASIAAERDKLATRCAEMEKIIGTPASDSSKAAATAKR